MIPWDDIEGDYTDLFPSGTGNVAKPARVALGAMVIKGTLGLTDEETVEQIRENPYLQYFLGYKIYTDEKPFDPSLMVRFRQRFSVEQLNALNETICKGSKKDDDEPPAAGGSGWADPDKTKENKGKARANVEFGAKLAISVVDGFTCLERLYWDNFNEGMTLKSPLKDISYATVAIRNQFMLMRFTASVKTSATAKNAASASAVRGLAGRRRSRIKK